MEIWRIAQVAYVLLNFGLTTILLIALATVLSWPGVRSRGLFLAALGVRLTAAFGWLALGCAQLVAIFGRFGSNLLSGEIAQVGYLLLAVVSLAGDGLLLAALISLGGVFRAIRRASQTNAPPGPTGQP